MVAKEVGAWMSFRQSEPRATRTRELCSNRRSNLFKMFRLHVVGLNMTCEVYVIPTKEESQYKQEMFRLVYPGLVEGLNKTKEGYVIPTKGGISEKTRD